jgi:hypothetical protein
MDIYKKGEITLIKFPSIEQFRNVIRNVTHRARFVGVGEDGSPMYNPAAPLPKLKYRGTVKLHGTNAGIVRNYKPVGDETGITFQSRERELTLTSDNAGFALFMSSKIGLINQMTDGIVTWFSPDWSNAPDKVVIFGEWCGGNIQSSVAINGLPKMFVIFGVKMIHGEKTQWIDLNTIKHIYSAEDNIYNILNFPNWEVEIDFEHPEEIQNQLVDMTIAVETECPVGKAFGNSGIGEGIVWQCIEPTWWSSDYWFKVKGEKHSASKVKKLASVDVEAIRAVNDFVDAVVTESRLVQGLQNLVREQQKPFEMTSMGDFIRWVFNDVVKEETDTIVASQLDPKKIGGPISNKARKWYTEKLNAGYVVEN